MTELPDSLRVALLAGGLTRGGAEKQLVYMARALRDAGVCVRVYTLGDGEFYEAALHDAELPPVWVGRAANYAAKLCALRENGFASYITGDVFDRMNEDAKIGGNPKQDIWEKRRWTAVGIDVYRSSWRWAP